MVNKMTNTTKKISKKDNYAAIIAILKVANENGMTLEGYDGITFESLVEFINHEVELLDSKAAAAQKRAAAKKAEGDALRERVFECLTNDPQTISAIVRAIDDPDVSANMVTSRLTQLCGDGRAVKDTVKVPAATEGGKAKTLSAYRLA